MLGERARTRQQRVGIFNSLCVKLHHKWGRLSSNLALRMVYGDALRVNKLMSFDDLISFWFRKAKSLTNGFLIFSIRRNNIRKVAPRFRIWEQRN